MTLKMLGEEYLANEQLLRKQIAKLRGMLADLTGNDSKNIQSRIRSLYEMAADAHKIGVYLTRYYEGGEPVDF